MAGGSGFLPQLIWSWWRRDKIRVSPAEGRLLRLQPPCYLRLLGETVEVRARRPLPGGGGVSYECVGTEAIGVGELRVRISARGLRHPPEVDWLASGAVEPCPLAADEVDVFAGR